MDTILVIIPVFIVAGVSIILKLSNYLFVLYKKRESNKEESINQDKIMNSTVSYEKFEAVSRESLTPNSPIRLNNDFFVFFMQHITTNADSLQNKVLAINFGEDYE
ncbi:MAG: hypothetical protein HDR30_00825 [Lachnospiraceae bacterium]|nr:hypothetical protein [Lachnospiraceae bacterium]